MLRFILILFFAVFGLGSTCYAESDQTNGLVNSIEKRLVDFIHETVNSLNYSAYKLGGSHFDPSEGVYILDCSNYVDQLLRTVTPEAYLSLVHSTGTETPTTQHYYNFFRKLPADKPKRHWNKVTKVKELQPGDILVFRYKKSSHRGGHVMVVMNKPKRDARGFLVQVADSAPSGHSQDTRPPHTSGIGIGTLWLKANPKTGIPAAYAWKRDSFWQKNVSFAMARPVEVS